MSAPSRLETTVGAVAVGRNEGERLRACIVSLMRSVNHIVYVDSGSTDDSVAIARQLGVEVVELDTSIGFTAARARNAGFNHLSQIAPRVEFVQFVDGDCVVVDGWTACAIECLFTAPEVAVVCGRRRERDPHRNWYHRLADMEWSTPIGEVEYCGGDALIRAAALKRVGGYREDLIAGEEPELCARLRQAGWKVWRLDHDMTLHDIRMSHFRQWWRRAVRAGYACTEGVARQPAMRTARRLKKIFSIWIWAFLPIAMLLLVWPTQGYSLLILMALYAFILVRIARRRAVFYGDTAYNSVLYAAACVVANWPQAIGSLMSLWNRVTRTPANLIEYASKKSEPNAAATSTAK